MSDTRSARNPAAADPPPGAEGPHPAQDAPTAGGRLGPWPLRVAMVAASGLVVAGVAFTVAGVVSALSGSTGPAGPGAVATTSEPSSERRTTALTGPDGTAESTGEEADTAAGDGGDAGAPAPAPGAGAPDGGAPDAGTAGSGAAGDGADGTDPRAQALEDMLNSPQERPPMEPLVSQEDVDAEREAAEAGIEPEQPQYGAGDGPGAGGQP